MEGHFEIRRVFGEVERSSGQGELVRRADMFFHHRWAHDLPGRQPDVERVGYGLVVNVR